ncbi:MAG: glucokinase [Methylotenera sp.]|uniref:glucokinase n=1 Tax=Methylotenera sp. TaxID=2051956 RepID=UPI0024870F28|nr:glucokinase [Methylotenera sp.]MDI1309281.1 glucokinase [Methylotenera sp.]
MNEYMLAGDVGGTKTNIAFYTVTGDFSPIAEHTYLNKEFSSLEQIIRQFYEDTGFTANTACFGIAGAIHDGRCDMPNLGWHIDSNALATSLGFSEVHLLNDLEATAYGIATLAPNQLATINEGTPVRNGNMALIAAGTGLGEAILLHTNNDYHVSASEGGHADFAPHNEEEITLLRHLTARYGHVSWERVVSGPGLKNIYDFLKTSQRAAEPAWLAELLAQEGDASAIIAHSALENEAEISTRALDIFMSAYGAEAGNLALKSLSTGGLYIGGGIAPKILHKFYEEAFVTSFLNKGRFSTLLAEMPLKVILEPKTALRGAVAFLRK